MDEIVACLENLEAAGWRATWTEPNSVAVDLPIADAMPRYAEVNAQTVLARLDDMADLSHYMLINIKESRSRLLS